jgi:uncharacterized protein YjiS (DUF1127 family)
MTLPRLLRLAWRRALRALVQRRRRARAHRDLYTLDPYMLRDIGLSHHAAGLTPFLAQATRAVQPTMSAQG